MTATYCRKLLNALFSSFHYKRHNQNKPGSAVNKNQDVMLLYVWDGLCQSAIASSELCCVRSRTDQVPRLTSRIFSIAAGRATFCCSACSAPSTKYFLLLLIRSLLYIKTFAPGNL